MYILQFGCRANDFSNLFIYSLLCVAMVTELVNDILQNVLLCATDYKQVYMN